MKIPAYKYHLSDQHIRETRTLFPEPMREPFTWLCCYLRDELHSEIDLLEAAIKDVGLTTTGGTITKMIMGRWDVDRHNQKLESPIINDKNFIHLVDRVRKNIKYKKLHGEIPFVETSTWDRVRDYIDLRRAENAVCKMGLILGPTGSQKGACEKHYTVLNNHGACTYHEAPDSASITKFARIIARGCGVPQSYSTSRMLDECEQSLNRGRTLILANIQRLYNRNAGWSQPIFDWIQAVQERTNCTVILEAAVSSDLVRVLRAGREHGYFEQFVGRCGGELCILDDYAPAADIYAIGAAFGLPEAKETFSVLDKIARRPGRIRTLFHNLQKAARIANAAKVKLTLDHVRDVINEVEKVEAERPLPKSIDELTIDGEMPTRGLLPAINNRQSTIRNPQSAI